MAVLGSLQSDSWNQSIGFDVEPIDEPFCCDLETRNNVSFRRTAFGSTSYMCRLCFGLTFGDVPLIRLRSRDASFVSQVRRLPDAVPVLASDTCRARSGLRCASATVPLHHLPWCLTSCCLLVCFFKAVRSKIGKKEAVSAAGKKSRFPPGTFGHFQRVAPATLGGILSPPTVRAVSWSF